MNNIGYIYKLSDNIIGGYMIEFIHDISNNTVYYLTYVPGENKITGYFMDAERYFNVQPPVIFELYTNIFNEDE